MGGKNKFVAPVSPAYGQQVDRYRPRTPAETVDDAYDAVIEVIALNTVTHMAYDSLRSVVAHKDQILAAHPELEPELNIIGAAHMQGLLSIQLQVTDNVKREK